MIHPITCFGPVDQSFDVTRTLSSTTSRIKFNGAVCVPAMQQVVACLEEAFKYYYYESVEIEINSPGGEIRALNYLLEHCEAWRDNGRSIGTRGVLSCGSAGALMLSFGDIGTRQVSRTTELLFHYSRAIMEKASVTADAADQLASHLNILDRKLIDALVRHILPQLDSTSFDGLGRMRARYQWLESSYPEGGGGPATIDQLCKKDLVRLKKVFAGTPEGMRERVIEHLRSRFRADQRMGLLEAYVLNLIDNISGVTPANEPKPAPAKMSARVSHLGKP